MIRAFFLFLLVINVALSEEYPRTFSQLSHPLFKSEELLNELLNIQSISKNTDKYFKELQEVKELGYKVDKELEPKKSKKYLLKLRKLQKNYDSIIREINKQISKSIDENDYILFCKLTQNELDGLLKSRSIYEKSLEFYKENNNTKRNNFFEKRMKYKKIEQETTEEFFNNVSTSTYDSKSKSSTKKKKVNLEVIDLGKHIAVYVENLNPYTVTVNLHGEYENLKYNKPKKDTFSLKSGVKKEYLRLYRTKGTISYGYSFSYSWIIGSVDAVHDDSHMYRLPFAKGTSHKVSQGFNGTHSHKGHSQYAIDFAMDEGTKIYASRAGVVVKTKENSDQGGNDKKYSSSGNYVTIEHDDTTFATYYHLKKNGALVKVGDTVKKGTLIAYSGNTGYSSGPHLHLAVFKASSATRTKTIKIKFLDENGIIHLPKKGVTYTAK